MLRTEGSIEGNGENFNLGGWHHCWAESVLRLYNEKAAGILTGLHGVK